MTICWRSAIEKSSDSSRDGTLAQRIPTRDAGWCIAADADAMWVGMQGAIDRLDKQGKVVETLSDPARLGSYYLAGELRRFAVRGRCDE